MAGDPGPWDVAAALHNVKREIKETEEAIFYAEEDAMAAKCEDDEDHNDEAMEVN